MCSSGGERCNLVIVLKREHSNSIFPLTYLPGVKQAIILKDAQCVNCRHANTQHKALIKPAQQHVTTLVSLHLFQAVPQLMSSLKVPFASMGVVNAAVPDAVAPCLRWLQAYESKQQIKFTAE